MSRGALLAYLAAGLAIAGAVLGSLPGAAPVIATVGVLAVALVASFAAAWTVSRERAAEAPEDANQKFRREAILNASSLVLLVVFLLLALTELLAIPAAFGQLRVFGTFAFGFIAFYPAIIGGLTAALAGIVLLVSGHAPVTRLSKRAHTTAGLFGSVALLFVLVAIAMAAGLFEGVGLKAERSVFMLAAAVVSGFFLVKTWLRLPAYAQVSDWLEREERLRDSGMIRKIAYGLLGVAGVGVLVTLIVTAGLGPRPVGLLAAGFAMLALLGATFNVGVSRVLASLELGMENAVDMRKKRRVILSAASIGLTLLSLLIGTLTLFAFLAQVAGVDVFRFLLEFYVSFYPIIFGVCLVPLIAAVVVRTRVQTEVAYSDKLKALSMGLATTTIVLVFFGVFIGSGLAEGSGIQIQNAVLVMGAGVLSLIQFVKARTLLPGVFSIAREAFKPVEGADQDTKDRIKNRMIAVYVTALVFVLGFAAFTTATSMGVVEPPAGIGTDIGVFGFVLIGIVILALVVFGYLQSANIDQRWASKKKQDIGKRRLTSEEVKRYLILGFSMGLSGILFILGILVQFGVIRQLGPLEADRWVATDLWVASILIGLGPYGWYASREARRIEAIDQRFPEFLRDLAESQRSGMTLTEAVATASKGNYGVLTGEIRKMAAQIEWGVSFSDSLTRFSKRVATPLIKRTVALVIQASEAGGNVVDVLTAAADDAREIQQIVKERKQAMSIYVMIIYIAFAVFVGVIAVLNAQFIPEVAKAVSKANGVSIGGLNFRAFDVDDFKILFFHGAIIQGFGGGIVGGVMAGGRMIHGLRHSFILVFLAWVLFRIVIG